MLSKVCVMRKNEMAIKKNAVRRELRRNFRITSASFTATFPVLVSLSWSLRKPQKWQEKTKKKVGRVVSLNIDLQGISELDRDAVIAPCAKKRERRRTRLCPSPEMHYVCSATCSAARMCNFLIQALRERFLRRNKGKLVSAQVLSGPGHLAFTYKNRISSNLPKWKTSFLEIEMSSRFLTQSPSSKAM